MSLTKRDEIFHYDFKIQGVRFRGSTGSGSRREAKQIENAKREEARGQVKQIKADRKDAPMTVNEAFDRFWLEVGLPVYSGTYQKTVKSGLAWMLKQFGTETLLRDVGPNLITQAIAKRRGEGVKNSTVNRTVVELLRTVMFRARKKWEQKDLQEIDWKDQRLSEPKERIRELREEEEVKLLASMRTDYLPAVRFAIVSGLRKKELISLTWDRIDWKAKTISVLGKGDKESTIPLTDGMIAILAPLRGHHPEFVFTYVCEKSREGRRHGRRYRMTYSGLAAVWRRFGPSAAGIKDYRFHDNRHTTATRLLRSSGNLRLVQKLLRHEDVGTSAKYGHVDDLDLRRAMQSVESTHNAYPQVVGEERESTIDTAG